MYDYLHVKDGAVVDGLEARETVIAKHQPQYIPLRALISRGSEGRVISRWTLTEEQRRAVAGGADIFLELLTFRQPLQPIRIAISDGKLDPDWVRHELLEEGMPVVDMIGASPATKSKLEELGDPLVGLEKVESDVHDV